MMKKYFNKDRIKYLWIFCNKMYLFDWFFFKYIIRFWGCSQYMEWWASFASIFYM